MKFSQRIGINPITRPIQLGSLNGDLRNGLWNIYNNEICSKMELMNYKERLLPIHELVAKHLWHNLYKKATDTIPYYRYQLLAFFRKEILEGEWFRTLELIEETFNYVKKTGALSEVIESQFNDVFEREFSGYRFINGLIAPISNDQELAGLEDAFITTKSYSSLTGCNIHLEMALRMLSDRNYPDFRNSIKESISAVESVAKLISGKQRDTLGSSLDRIKGQIRLHEALEGGFKKLYGYTSDADGIRHALMESPNCDFDDAKYMLISCSAFINFLISKANRAGIFFQ